MDHSRRHALGPVARGRGEHRPRRPRGGPAGGRLHLRAGTARRHSLGPRAALPRGLGGQRPAGDDRHPAGEPRCIRRRQHQFAPHRRHLAGSDRGADGGGHPRRCVGRIRPPRTGMAESTAYRVRRSGSGFAGVAPAGSCACGGSSRARRRRRRGAPQGPRDGVRVARAALRAGRRDRGPSRPARRGPAGAAEPSGDGRARTSRRRRGAGGGNGRAGRVAGRELASRQPHHSWKQPHRPACPHRGRHLAPAARGDGRDPCGRSARRGGRGLPRRRGRRGTLGAGG